MKKQGIPSKVALYARVSTHDKGQDPELQLVPLREYANRRELNISGEFVDIGISGSKDKRPQLDRLMDAARKRQIDTVLVWKLDRFGRSLKQLVTALDELTGLGIGFISYQDNIDLTTPQGRLMFHIIASMAEFERELVKERVKAGLDNAKRKGKRLGRKPIPQVTHERIYELRHQGLSLRQIAKKLEVSVGKVHGVVAAASGLDKDQKIAQALEIEPHFAEEARKREMAGKGSDGSGGRGHKKNPVENVPQGLKSRDQAASSVGLSAKLVAAT